MLSGAAFLAAAATAHAFTAATTPMYLFGLPSITLALAALLTLSLGQGAVARAMRVSWLRWLGGISYGVYVYHVLFSNLFHQLGQRIAPHASREAQLCLIFFVAAGLTLLISWLSFRFFESPILKLKDRARKPAPAAPDVPAAVS